MEQYPEKQVTLLLEPVQEKFSFLKYADQITQKKESTEPYDLFFSLDCSDTERLHEFKKYFEEAKYKICVDHHFTNQGFGDLQFIVPDASSTCEVLFSMFEYTCIMNKRKGIYSSSRRRSGNSNGFRQKGSSFY